MTNSYNLSQNTLNFSLSVRNFSSKSPNSTRIIIMLRENICTIVRQVYLRLKPTTFLIIKFIPQLFKILFDRNMKSFSPTQSEQAAKYLMNGARKLRDNSRLS